MLARRFVLTLPCHGQLLRMLARSLLPLRATFASTPSSSSSAALLSRSVSTSRPLASASKPLPTARPGPPKLPRAEQREFERLVAAASTSGAFSTPPDQEPKVAAAVSGTAEQTAHPDARRTPKPDFDGERNPVTGEIGGPKKDPLLHREWTYGGRATDF
jgi:hypothetical protein